MAIAAQGRLRFIHAAANWTICGMFRKFCLRFVVVVLYTVVGAIVFMNIEAPTITTWPAGSPTKEEISKFVNQTSHKLTVSNISSANLKDIGNEILTFVAGGSGIVQTKSERFTAWMYFSIVTITTIGYGDITPKTDWGKAFVMIFSVIGIPLMLWLLALTGQIQTEFIRQLVQGIVNLIKRSKKEESTKMKHSDTLILVFAIIGTVALHVVGASATKHGTNWPYLDCFYFWFCTSTTIGYGDLTQIPHKPISMFPWVLAKLMGLAQMAGLVNTILCWLQLRRFSEIADKGGTFSCAVGKRQSCDFQSIAGEYGEVALNTTQPAGKPKQVVLMNAVSVSGDRKSEVQNAPEPPEKT